MEHTLQAPTLRAKGKSEQPQNRLFHSLYSRLVVVFVSLLFLTACSYSAIAYFLAQRSTAANHQAIHQPLARTFAAQLAPTLEHALDIGAVKELFHSLMQANPNIELYYLDGDANILAHTLQLPLQRMQIDMEPLARLLEGRDSYPIYADDPSTAKEQALFSVAMVPHGGELNTYIYVVLWSENHAMLESRRLAENLWSLGFLALVGSLALALVSGLWLFRKLTVRLRQLGHVMENASSHGFSSPHRYALLTGDSSNDEIAHLGSRFDRMAQRIQQQMNDLQAQDNTRRQLLANISHDLRTPLASLRGYIETLQLKDSSLTPELRQEFQQTAFRQCVRLQQLIDDMFEVAKLDSSESSFDTESFSLEELAHDSMLDYKVSAEKAGIKLRFSSDKSGCVVDGNLAGIQRVLDNLLSNAIRFTPNGGRIDVAVQQLGAKALVAVHNTGSYISKSERAAIFERFYQSGNSHRSGEHAGLGLAIAMRVIERHGEQLTVQSSRENGTTFEFSMSLDRAQGPDIVLY